MTLDELLHALRTAPERIAFDDVIAAIDARYAFTPTAFANGDLHNAAGQNNGSCRIFAFARRHHLTEPQTLACFGQHYRDVVNNPAGTDHQNIRHFMRHGWAGITFTGEPLQEKSRS